ncbi:reverse transcriptase domain-containing protein [Tanacetum coccineum]
MLSNPEVTGRLLKWRFELEEHDIHYRPRTSVKGQILTGFIVECPEDDPLYMLMEDKEELPNPWILFKDGSSCIDGFGAGLKITNPEGIEFTYALRFRFNATNNEAEYKALIAGLQIAERMGVKNLQANVKNLASAFKEFSIKQVPRGENKKADTLNEKEVLAVVEEEGHTWMTPIYEYLTEKILPEEKRKARAIRRKADARNLIRECNSCQANHPVPRNPQQKLTPITSPWPFYKWGVDIVGPFPEGPNKVKFLIVAIDYFTKWIKAKPVATITGAQFRDNPFKDWCEKLCIRQCFTSVKHPQANGLVERANRSLGKGINARLDERSKNWLEEISHVLWAHRTMIKSSNGETPFSLTYGAEAVIPVKIGMPTLRTTKVDMIKNDEALEINLDLLEEKREQAAIQKARSKAKMEKYYNTRVRSTCFCPGDLVYQNNEASSAKD